MSIILPGPTPQSLVLSPQAPEAEEKVEKKSAVYDRHNFVLNENIMKVLFT